MRHLLKTVFSLLAVVVGVAAAAQSSGGAFLKYDIDGKTISIKSDELDSYHKVEAGNEDKKASSEHVFYISILSKQVYKLDIKIHTPPHTNPVVGKLPYVATVYGPEDPAPAAYISVTKVDGDKIDFYGSKLANAGYFEITKVAAGWVEGKFSLDMPKLFAFDGGEVLHITNGAFRFKIKKESKD